MGKQKKLEASQLFKRTFTIFLKKVRIRNETTEKDKVRLLMLISPEYSTFKDHPLTKNSVFSSELQLKQIESLTNIERCSIKFSIKK